MGRVIWWRITGHKFVAGLRVEDGVVVETAPILRRSLGRRWPDVRAYFESRGWHGAPLPEARR